MKIALKMQINKMSNAILRLLRTHKKYIFINNTVKFAFFKIFHHKYLFISVFISAFSLYKVFFSSLQAVFTKSVIVISLFLLCLHFIKEPHKINSKNKYLIWIFSAFLSIIIVFGSIALKNDTVFQYIHFSISLFLSLIGIWIVFVNLIVVSINKLSMYSIKYDSDGKIEKKLFFTIWIWCFILWLPYLFAYYPGHLSWDSTFQWMQATGYVKLSNSHPFIHTLLIRLCYKIGCLFSENANFHVAVYSIAQLLIMSAIISYSIAWLKKYRTPSLICFIVFIWYAIHPIFGSYGIIMWKDVLSGGFILLETLCIADIVLTKGKCLLNRFFILFWIIITILCCFLRHNAIYAILATLFILPFVSFNRLRKELIFYCTCLIVFIILINFSINNIFHVKSSSSSLLLAIPVQQISRTVSHNGNISDNDRLIIEKLASFEQIKKSYVIWFSDPSVGLFSKNINEVKKWQFIKLWISLLIKNPTIYIDAFIYQTYGFWYPLDISRNYIERGYVSTPADRNNINLGISPKPIFPLLKRILDNFFIITMKPGINLIWGIGIHFILLLYCGILFWTRSNKQMLSCLLPSVFIWGTLMISTPLWLEWRYAFSFFTVLPIICVLAFFDNKIDVNNKV